MAAPDQRQERVEFGRLSSWRESAGIDDAQAREHAARLELRARAESETAVRNEYIEMLGVAPGNRVLDLGCGSGAVTRALARRVVPGGHVVGMDASASMLKIARELADESGVGENIEFKVGDCRALPLPDASFDCVLAATMLSHVPNPECALAEMVRVTRSGGRVGVFDVDGDLTLFSHPDRVLTRRIVASFSDLGWVNGLFARRLPSVLAGLGVVNIKVKGFIPLESGGYYANRAASSAEAAAEEGAITHAEKAHWLDTLRLEIAAKRFLGGQVHLFVWGTAPPKRCSSVVGAVRLGDRSR